MRNSLARYFTSIVLLISTNCWSQTRFTNGQVYNYEVGDIMQTRTDHWWGESSPDSYTTSTIRSKLFSINLDTIYYIREVHIYTIYHHVADSSRFETKMDTLVVSNLNDTIVPINSSDSCFKLMDTTYMDNCGNNTWYINPVGDTSCWHAFAEETWYIEGLGGYYSSNTNEIGETKKHDLIYYKKSTDSCGTLVTGVKENRSFDLTFKIYPNPARNELYVDGLEPGISYSYIISSIQGQLLHQGPFNNVIDVRHLKEGIYLVAIKSENDLNIARFWKR